MTVARKRALKAAVAVLAAVLAVYILWANTALTVSRFEIRSELLPHEFSGFRIAHISDLHNAEFGKNNEKLINEIRLCEPDIIVITGDLVDSYRTDIDAAVNFSIESAKIAPTYYVSGNHEYRIDDYDTLRSRLLSAGVRVLEDGSTTLECGDAELTLIGLRDPCFEVGGDMFGEAAAMTASKLTELMGETDDYTVLLTHRPELFDVYVSCGVNLVFSGHAHGGQIRLPFIGGLFAPNQGFFPKYDSGVYKSGDTSMAVSRGLGNSALPIRINNRPEVVLVELIRPDDAP